MPNIHVSRGETKLGIFSEEEVREGLRNGRFLLSDLGWRDGMPAWLPLSQFPDLTTTGATPAAPTTSIIPTGLPWDRRQELGFFPAFFETLKLVLLEPAAAFTAMKTTGGLAEPLIYAVSGGSVGCLFYILFSVFLSSFGIMSDRNVFAGMLGLGIGAIFLIILIPVFVAVGAFIGSAVLHLCLTLVGGAKRDFETTFRVLCFSAGSAYPLMIVPICGGLISGIWCLVCECIGLAKAHDTTTGKALLAVLLPVIVCCGGGFVCAMMFGVLGALTGHH
jgi:hypothetical protein